MVFIGFTEEGKEGRGVKGLLVCFLVGSGRVLGCFS